MKYNNLFLLLYIIVFAFVTVGRSHAESEPEWLSTISRYGDWTLVDARRIGAASRLSGRYGAPLYYITPRSDDRDKNYRFSLSCNSGQLIFNVSVEGDDLDHGGRVDIGEFVFYVGKAPEEHISGKAYKEAFLNRNMISVPADNELVDYLMKNTKIDILVNSNIVKKKYNYNLTGGKDAANTLISKCKLK